MKEMMLLRKLHNSSESLIGSGIIEVDIDKLNRVANVLATSPFE